MFNDIFASSVYYFVRNYDSSSVIEISLLLIYKRL